MPESTPGIAAPCSFALALLFMKPGTPASPTAPPSTVSFALAPGPHTDGAAEALLPWTRAAVEAGWVSVVEAMARRGPVSPPRAALLWLHRLHVPVGLASAVGNLPYQRDGPGTLCLVPYSALLSGFSRHASPPRHAQRRRSAIRCKSRRQCCHRSPVPKPSSDVTAAMSCAALPHALPSRYTRRS